MLLAAIRAAGKCLLTAPLTGSADCYSLYMNVKTVSALCINKVIVNA